MIQFAAAFKLLTPELVTDEASVLAAAQGGGKTVQTASVTAHFANGTLERDVQDPRDPDQGGKRLDKCELRKVNWIYRIASPSIARAMTSRWISLVPS